MRIKDQYLAAARRTIEEHAGDRDFRVLDAATGAGSTLLEIAAYLRQRQRLVSIDLNPGNHERLAPALRERRLAVEFVCGDIRDMRCFEPRSFDLICCDGTINMLGHDYWRGCREFRRVLRPGGRLLIREVLPPSEGTSLRSRFWRVVEAMRCVVPKPIYVMLPPSAVAACLEQLGFAGVAEARDAGGIWKPDETESAIHLNEAHWYPLTREDLPMRDAFLSEFRAIAEAIRREGCEHLWSSYLLDAGAPAG